MKQPAFSLGILLALALVLSAASLRGDDEAEPSPALADRADIPAAARDLANPVAPTPEAIERGRLYFSSQCTMCHGAEGDGKGDLVGRLKLEIPDFRTREFQSSWTDGELHYVITEGHGRMKGEGERLPDGWKWEMILYIRSLAR